MKKFVICLLLCFSVLTIFAQRRSLHKFKTYNGKDYLVLGIGPNYMFGDAGGSMSQLRLWANDWDVLYTRPSITWGYKHEYNDIIANKLLFQYSLFSGNDDDSRNNRQFRYYANGLEASLQFEIYFFKGRYGRQDFDMYAYFGAGGLFYNTHMKYVNSITGELITRTNPFTGKVETGRVAVGKEDTTPEGMEYNPDTKYFEYSGKTIMFPFGLGARFPINNDWSFGGEFGWRYPIGADADFIDGFYTYWSEMNDVYVNFNLCVTYKVAGGDNCYSKYGRKNVGWRRKINSRSSGRRR